MCKGIPTKVSEDIEADDCYDDKELPFDRPEELKEFKSSQPVSNAQFIAYETEGREPYPGYANELARWRDQNDQFQHRVLEVQGGDTSEPCEHVDVLPLENVPVINEIIDPGNPGDGEAYLYMPGDDEPIHLSRQSGRFVDNFDSHAYKNDKKT